MNTVPEEIRLAKNGETLAVVFSGNIYPLSAEYLRVCSPSAEVRGHDGKGVLVSEKKAVQISDIQPVGNYAIRLFFSDGHNSGIYSWETLFDLAHNHKHYWQNYLQALQMQGKSREAGESNNE